MVNKIPASEARLVFAETMSSHKMTLSLAKLI